MHSKSKNIKITSYNDANEVIKNSLMHLNQRIKLEESIERSEFIFDSVQIMYFKYHKVNFKRGGSYIYSPDKIKIKATINPKN